LEAWGGKERRGVVMGCCIGGGKGKMRWFDLDALEPLEFTRVGVLIGWLRAPRDTYSDS